MVRTELNSWERVKLAIQHEETDRPPVDFAVAPELVDRLLKELSLSSHEELLELLGVDIRVVRPKYIGPKDRFGELGVDALGATETTTDIWGVVRTPVQNRFQTYSEIVHHPLADAQSLDEIENFAWPSVDWYDFSHIEEQIKEWDRKQKRWITCAAGGAFESPWYMRGLEQYLMDLIENPELTGAIVRHVTDFYIEYGRRIFEASNGRLDMIETGGDLGTQQGMLLSPNLWRQRVKPGSYKLISTFAGYGVKTCYHSDGAIRPVIPDFIDMGLDVLDPIQPLAKGMDPILIKKDFGDRITLHGAIDEQELLPHAGANEVFEHTRRLAGMMSAGGGYILCASQILQADTPTENILAMYHASGSLNKADIKMNFQNETRTPM